MIKIDSITAGYDNNIFENANTTIDNNKITFIIGKNGSGKSTLANILTGLLKLKKGKIIIDNKEINKKTKLINLRTTISMVFQNPSNQILFNRVYDDIKFTLENINTKKEEIDSKIKESLKIVDMEEYINANPYLLSGGEKQRIAIASILALNPNYIIFDESTSMLDINGKESIYKLLNTLKRKKIGIIFITNIMDELIYADDILIIDNKQIYKYTKKELFNNLNILKEHNLELPFTLKVIDILNKKGIKTYNEKDILKELDK